MHKEKWNRKYSERPAAVQAEPSPVLAKHARDLSPGRALDLAAGDGRNALYLAREGWSVTAVDFSDVAVRRGTELAKNMGLSLRWEVEDLTAYVPEKGEYDLVCIFYLHLPGAQLSVVLHRAAEALAPGGTLLVVGHDISNIREGTGGPQDPALLYAPDNIRAELGTLEVVYAGTERNPVDHGSADRNKVQIDCVVRALRPAARL